MLKKYLPEGMIRHVGSSGFVNHWRGAGTETVAAMARRVLRENPDCVIVNGQDDLTLPVWERPEDLCKVIGTNPVALFHTGWSGFSSSGVVLRKRDFAKLRREYAKRYGRSIERAMQVYGLR